MPSERIYDLLSQVQRHELTAKCHHYVQVLDIYSVNSELEVKVSLYRCGTAYNNN